MTCELSDAFSVLLLFLVLLVALLYYTRYGVFPHGDKATSPLPIFTSSFPQIGLSSLAAMGPVQSRCALYYVEDVRVDETCFAS